MAVERQSSTLPLAQPSYIFRGHTAQIHSVQFVRNNTRLLTGDADGWVVCWKLESKRPVAVWKAHDAAILGTAEWGSDRVLTHGRDNNLRIWQLRTTDESLLSTALPVDGSSLHRPRPWLLHTLPVNTLNFCAFSMCPMPSAFNQGDAALDEGQASSTGLSDSVFVAVPARDDKKVEVYRFPDEKLMCVVPRVQQKDTGMVMAVKLVQHQPSNGIMVIAGYEGGYTAVHYLDPQHRPSSKAAGTVMPEFAHLLYLSQPHTQPILSLDALPDSKIYFTSSADAAIAVHCIPDPPHNINVQFAQSSIATAGRFQGNSTGSSAASQVLTDHVGSDPSTLAGTSLDSQEAAVTDNTNSPPPTEVPPEPLTFDKKPVKPGESASAPLTFTKQSVTSASSQTTTSKPAGLSSLLSPSSPQEQVKPAAPSIPTVNSESPHRIVQTKHAGQQSLRVRSDNRILATGGWDSRVRIYSVKTLKELAVLKWHKESVYAVDFASIVNPSVLETDEAAGQVNDQSVVQPQQQLTGLGKLQKQREQQIKLKHWIAAGSKDGKVSLWEVY
ncbi:WD40-repeat-containing domain protein [Lophiotrema nucula]|uniref:ASTRA-associated protein 1 n=1 Tax=Lophiotrema nucula TaxID=690887 RepID=A0A6A5ZRE0_9PLEO|nr:WD40-repeat-containing domain protein [Lophiotrema nucula]